MSSKSKQWQRSPEYISFCAPRTTVPVVTEADDVGSDQAATPPERKHSSPEKKDLCTPETDTSWAAYRVFIATVLCEALLFSLCSLLDHIYSRLILTTMTSTGPTGICLSFGVFQDYYTHRASLQDSEHSSWIGVLSAGIPYLGAPLLTYCCETFTIPRHHYIYVGWVLCLVGLLSSAFCHNMDSLIATQGLTFGVSVLLVEMPSLIILNTWFARRRGLAYGVLCGLTDLLGVAWGFLANALLGKRGLRTTFLAFTAVCFVLPGLGIPFLKERASTDDSTPHMFPNKDVPSTDAERELSPSFPPTRRYYHRRTFYVLLLSNLIQSFAFYLPFIYLPSYNNCAQSLILDWRRCPSGRQHRTNLRRDRLWHTLRPSQCPYLGLLLSSGGISLGISHMGTCQLACSLDRLRSLVWRLRQWLDRPMAAHGDDVCRRGRKHDL